MIQTFSGRQVWLSGHTGFKGSWLAQWLGLMGARVTGFSLPPATEPSLFHQLRLKEMLYHQIGDIRDATLVRDSILAAEPDFLFHLAAQPLVRQSYIDPIETYQINVMGTVHVLNALRDLKKPCVAVFITTDKCYENRESFLAYREDDPLGGYDPYSSSKAAAELAISSWRRSYFASPATSIRIASARAGNVIGGGDWSMDRIVPDAVRSLAAGKAIPVRNPASTRPWQHVLEPVCGYLKLAAALSQPEADPRLMSAFNFGPNHDSNRSVKELVEEVLVSWPGKWAHVAEQKAPHEAALLHLANEKAYHLLKWQPRWNFNETVGRTIDWYRKSLTEPESIIEITNQQIRQYQIEMERFEIRAESLSSL